MTSSSVNAFHALRSPKIIHLAARRRLRQCVGNLLALAHSREFTIGGMMRLVADANAAFGDELVAAILRTLWRDQDEASDGIALFRIIASPAARTALWSMAQDDAWTPPVQAEALWALHRLGEPVSSGQLSSQATPPWHASGHDVL